MPDSPDPSPPEKPKRELSIWEDENPKTWGARLAFESVRIGCLSLILFSCVGLWWLLPAAPEDPPPERPAWTAWGWILAVGGFVYGCVRAGMELAKAGKSDDKDRK